MYILLVFFILIVLSAIILLSTNIKVFIKIKSNNLNTYTGIYLINIPIFKINTKRLSKRSNKTGKKSIEYSYIKDILKMGFVKLEKLKLKADISILDPILTAYTVAVISSAIAIIMRYYNIKVNYKNYEYRINPIYKDKIIVNVELDSIIKVNLVHIICIIYRKWRRDFYGRKTPN